MSSSPERTTIAGEGPSCAACAPAVEKSLARTPGRQSAFVNYAIEKATVQYLPGQAKPGALKATLENAGYGVAERPPKTSAADCHEIDQQKAVAYRQLRDQFRVTAAEERLPQLPGYFDFTCGMRILRGSLVMK